MYIDTYIHIYIYIDVILTHFNPYLYQHVATDTHTHTLGVLTCCLGHGTTRLLKEDRGRDFGDLQSGGGSASTDTPEGGDM